MFRPKLRPFHVYLSQVDRVSNVLSQLFIPICVINLNEKIASLVKEKSNNFELKNSP